MTEFDWYLFGALAAVSGALVNMQLDCWLAEQSAPYSLGARLAIAARWGFFFGILLYAWLIDSRRVPYDEAGLWLIIGAGAVGVVALKVAMERSK